MSFEVIAAIDLVGGKVVRVERGDLDRQTVYSDDPVATARRWVSAGSPRLHVVDLEGAVAGEQRHADVVAAIVAAVDVPVQVAGAIRSVEAIERTLTVGADRVVLGTRALTDDDFLVAALARAGDRVVVAPDVRDGEVRVAGWTAGTGEDVMACVRRLAAAGVPRILCTDIGRDGMLSGPNVDLLADVAATSGLPVIASGGVSGAADVEALRGVAGIEGVVVGKALYEGTLDLGEVTGCSPSA